MAGDDSIVFLGDFYAPAPISASGVIEGPFVTNLEGGFGSSPGGTPGKVNLPYTGVHLSASFGRPPAAVTLANNHVMDFGSEGLRRTLEALDAENIPHCGAGLRAENYGNPLMLRCGAHVVALLAYVCDSTNTADCSNRESGVAEFRCDVALREIAEARRRGADRIVVSMHWGCEEVFLPKRTDVERGRLLVDAGADLVIGHHAHRIQACERYRGKMIYYGLGNCVMPDLDVPIPAASPAEPAQRYRKVQRRSNCRSLAVRLVPSTGETTAEILEFSNGCLGYLGPAKQRYERSRLGSLTYPCRFRTSYFLGKSCSLAAAMVREPRCPRLRHLRLLAHLLFRRPF